MNYQRITAVFGTLVLALALSAFAGDTTDTKDAKVTTADTKEETNPRTGNQTHCPVMGGKIDSTVFTDIQGQRVYHCCPAMCSDKVAADPDKYFRKAAEEGVRFENIQTTCPVSGEELEEFKVIDYEGRRVLVCCDKCVKTFAKDPAKYLVALNVKAEPKTEKKAEVKTENADGHGHDHGHNH